VTVTAAILPKLHTRLLLKALRMTRARGSHMAGIIEDITGTPYPDQDEVQEEDTVTTVDADLIGGHWEELSEVTIAQLKEELAKREHIPNKPEARQIRQERAAQGRQRGRRDR
jgi:hypothetical protein